jgi:tetratricopeptide (TPR) repeat protein
MVKLGPSVRTIFLPAAFLVFAAFVIYHRSLHGALLWDDGNLITDNPELRDAAGLRDIWTAPPATDYWPLTWTLLWIEWHLWGNQVFGYHLVSWSLHVTSGFLIWWLMARLGLRWAWLAGFLFVIHPLAVESVAWMSEIKNTLSLPLALLSMLCWLQARKSRAAWALSVAFYLAAMLAKTSVVMLPAVFLLHAWWRDQRISKRDLVCVTPFAVIALGLGLITLNFQRYHPAAVESSGHGFFALICSATSNVFFYLEKFVYPAGLLPIYPQVPFDPPSWHQILSVPLLLAVFICLWMFRDGWGRHALLGFGFFVLNLLPVLGFLPMVYLSLSRVANHFVYLPMIGLVGLAALALQGLYDRRGEIPRGAALGLSGIIAVVWIFQASHYASKFLGPEALWKYTLARNPAASPGYDEIGVAMLDRGDAAGALAQFELGLRYAPSNPALNSNAAICLLRLDRAVDALEPAQRALESAPNSDRAHIGLGNVLMQLDRPGDAAAQFAAAVKLSPDNPDSHTALLNALAQAGDFAGALAEANEVVRLRPDAADALASRGEIKRCLGDLTGAVADLDRAIALYPSDGKPYVSRGVIKQVNGDSDAALDDLRRFRQLSPTDPNADYAALWMWVIESEQGRTADADRDLRAALARGWLAKPSDRPTRQAQFLLGSGSAAAFLAAQPDEPGPQCEAHYYAGIKQRLKGDKAGAAASFRASLATGCKDYFEYTLAQGELIALATH